MINRLMESTKPKKYGGSLPGKKFVFFNLKKRDFWFKKTWFLGPKKTWFLNPKIRDF